VRDTTDRRRVYVEANRQALGKASYLYAEHAQLAEDLYHRYTEEQLQLLLEFVTRSRQFNELKAAELEAELAKQNNRPTT
jgi:DNA-binding MarR family transcriptional regulator